MAPRRSTDDHPATAARNRDGRRRAETGSKHRNSRFGATMERISEGVTRWTGSTAAFVIAAAAIVLWLVLGPVFHFSDTWQLVINTATTIVTFLMVFLIQRAQNKDARAVAVKLNELIAAMEGASNRLIGAESLTEAELDVLHDHFQRLVTMAQSDRTLLESHSIEEAEGRHARKEHVRHPGGPRGPARRTPRS